MEQKATVTTYGAAEAQVAHPIGSAPERIRTKHSGKLGERE